MSWTEVKKINGDLTKPLDNLIAEETSALQESITAAKDSLLATNLLETLKVNSEDYSLDKLIARVPRPIKVGLTDNLWRLTDMPKEQYVTLGELNGCGMLSFGYLYQVLVKDTNTAANSQPDLWIRFRVLCDDVPIDFVTVGRSKTKREHIHYWSFSSPGTDCVRRDTNHNLEGLDATHSWTDISRGIWFRHNLKVQVYYYLQNDVTSAQTDDYVYRWYFNAHMVSM